jgi:hypothetical protein
MPYTEHTSVCAKRAADDVDLEPVCDYLRRGMVVGATSSIKLSLILQFIGLL